MAVTGHVEVERTWELAPGARLPDLSTLPGVAEVEPLDDEQLDARYFDTSDLRLARARTTLRRRTGGRDAGWHLKLPLADGVREELQVPLPDGRATAPPRPLTSLVRSRTRGARLARVVRIRTHRRVLRLLDVDRRVLAEVADDTVTGDLLLEPARTVVWREVEVELVDGDVALLDAVGPLLQQAGAVPAARPSKLARTLGSRLLRDTAGPADQTAGAALVSHLAAQVGELVARDPDVRRDRPDAVHKMRVATRRLRSALTSFGPLLDRSVTDPLREELKHLAAVLGEARDAEVLRARLAAGLAELPSELVPDGVAQRIDEGLEQRYRAAHARVVAELDGRRYGALLDDLDRLLTAPPVSDRAGGSADDELRRLVRRSWRRLAAAVERAEQAAGAEREELLHDARKQAKRVRYAAEAAAPVLGRRATGLAGRAEQVQEVLGAHQDSVVARQELLDLAAGSDRGEDGFVLGLLHARQQAAGHDAVDELRGVWRKAVKSGAVRRLG